MDSVEIGLITCSPHEEVYSLYGHTAIRYCELNTGRDLMFNYGVFNFKAPHFVLRFVFGQTDYELGVVPTGAFCKYYEDWGSQVSEQVLNLTREEKVQIAHALSVNLQPENRVYRYNFFYDNCSTRPRDIIEHNLMGKVIYDERTDYSPTYREMIHDLNGHHPWARMGNDLLLGVRADLKTTRSQQEFLPGNLQYDFDHAQIYANGEYRPLVKERRTLVGAGVQMVEKEFPLSPTDCVFMLTLISLGLLLVEWKRRRCFVWYDGVLMLLTGLAGCIIVVMFFSEHPTTSTNLQVLLLNPLHLFYLPAVLRRRKTHYWVVLPVLVVLFLLGSIWQDYAEGMEILALCLLTRCLSHWRNDK
ncbi:MAG: DUF4105 domain-containing protein [Prevotella sp.]|nr:DUF4105 domain-containing protein [Prevotella sp.]